MGKRKQQTKEAPKRQGAKFSSNALNKKVEKSKEKQKHKRQNGFNQVRELTDLLRSAEARQCAFTQSKKPVEKEDGMSLKDGAKRAFYKEFRKVVEQADVVLQVLDARDPEGCRCKDAETAVLANYNKRLILVLNKIDLVPPETAKAWHKHLSKQFPTVLFKANTQNQKGKLCQAKMDVMSVNHKMMNTSACLGAKELMKVLGNYTRNKGLRTSIRVGVVGLPNVGKSSLINSLLRNRSCTVGAIPGVTRNIQEVELDKNIKLLDSPGVVMINNVGPLAMIQNSVKLDHLEDPVKPIELIIAHCGIEQLASHYNLPAFTNATELLSLLAFRQGKLLQGGRPDAQAAAKLLLKDWSNGTVQFYTSPPQQQALPSHISAEVVTTWAAEFNLQDLDTVTIADEMRTETDLAEPLPELSVVFRTEKPKDVTVEHCELYEQPHLQNNKEVKNKVRKVKRERKKMDKFSDMFDNACQMDEGSSEEMEELDEAETLYKNSGL